MNSVGEARAILNAAWVSFSEECQSVLGGELHYQAMLYHALRNAGAPVAQVGMNVRQQVRDPQTALYRRLRDRKHIAYQAGFEAIPDIVLFRPEAAGDWRRRRAEVTLQRMLVAIEIKASERSGGRLSRAEVLHDIRKLAAHLAEVQHLGFDLHPVVAIVDVAPLAEERMRPCHIQDCAGEAESLGVEWRYLTRA